MKKITLAQALELQKKADTPELVTALLQALLDTVGLFEKEPDQSLAINNLQLKLEDALQAKTDAEEMANDALESVNKILASVPQDTIVTIEKKKYKVLFAVDGLTKETLAKDKDKLKKLVSIGSGALELQEDK